MCVGRVPCGGRQVRQACTKSRGCRGGEALALACRAFWQPPPSSAAAHLRAAAGHGHHRELHPLVPLGPAQQAGELARRRAPAAAAARRRLLLLLAAWKARRC